MSAEEKLREHARASVGMGSLPSQITVEIRVLP
jgi:hypothetical protein